MLLLSGKMVQYDETEIQNLTNVDGQKKKRDISDSEVALSHIPSNLMYPTNIAPAARWRAASG